MELFRITIDFLKDVEKFMPSVRKRHFRSKVTGGDIRGGHILTLTAQECAGTPKCLPAGMDTPPRDQTGLPMAIWHHDIRGIYEELQ